MNILVAVLLLMASSSVGCATIVTSDTVDVSLATSPPGAKAHVNGQSYSTTSPVSIPVRRGKEPTIHIEKDGYEPQDIKLNREFGGWVWGNLLFGGVIGLVIDLVTEHAYGIEPDEIHVSLHPVSSPPPQKIAMVASVPPGAGEARV